MAETDFVETAADAENVVSDIYETSPVTTVQEDITYEPVSQFNQIGLPDCDFGGYDFNILNVGRSDSFDDFAADENGATVLEQAVYNRNCAVEDLYNIRINNDWRVTTANMQSPEAYRTLVIEATAGNTNYDLCVIPGYDAGELAYGGFLADLNTLPYFDATKSYYDQNAVEDIAFGDVLFYVTGDYGINMMNNTNCIAFNKKLVEDYKLGDMYDLVNTKQWTLEKMSELSKLVAAPDKSIYGNIYHVDSIQSAFNASGERLVTLDENTMTYTLGGNSARANDTIRSFVELVLNGDVSYRYQYNDMGKEWANMFNENRALFLLTTLNNLAELRNSECDFGILPYFLYDETQENYYSSVMPFNADYMCVPLVVENAERTSAIMEAIGYFSEQTILPAYYETVLYGKYVRDLESVSMLDIILDNRVYDLGFIYQPAHINKQLLYMLNDGTNDWENRYNSLSLSAKAMLDAISERYREL